MSFPWPRWLGAAPLMLLAACSAPPVDWSADTSVTVAAGPHTLSPDGQMQNDTTAALAARLSPPGGACPASLRLSYAGRVLYAAWWSPRPDSSARLVVAHSPDGGVTWSAVSPVDTTDHGSSGCRRAPPAIVADSTNGYVHVTYALTGAEGPGLFFSHSMDQGDTFHAPVPILYGERLGRTSVAASGDNIAVAFEDPNGTSPRIGLALSRTMGHIFEERMLPVSDDNGSASDPLVAMKGSRIAIAWREREGTQGDRVFRVRSGTLH